MRKFFKNISNIIGLLSKNYFVIIALIVQQYLIEILGLKKYTLDIILRYISVDWQCNVVTELFVRFFAYFVLSIVIFSGIFAILRREYFSNKRLIIIFLEGIKKYWQKVSLSFIVFYVPFKIIGSFVMSFLLGYDWIYSIVFIFLWIYGNVIFVSVSFMLINNNTTIKDILERAKIFILSKRFIIINIAIILISVLIAPFYYLVCYLYNLHIPSIFKDGRIDPFALHIYTKPSMWLDCSILIIKTIGKSLIFVYMSSVCLKER